jgi:Fe-Mn family superoxide dismutase
MKSQSDSTIVADADRRALLQATVAGIGAALLTTPNAGAQERGTRVRAESFAQVHQPKPLPFDSASLNGLSQRLIDSHWSNNYGAPCAR